MKLSALIRGLALPGSAGADPEVTGLQLDSRRVAAGDLFAALPGEQHDGRRFVPEAESRGAVAVLAAGPPLGPVGVPWLECEDPRALLGTLAARAYGHPERELDLIGVTGTNGKSTVVWTLAAVLDAAGRPCGRIGTVAYGFGELQEEAVRTTPEAPDLYRWLRRMREAGADSVAMEVSSHALAQHRVDGLGFRVAVFTNLTQDHLDYHGDMERYFAAKRRLFEQLSPEGCPVVHVGDPFGRRLSAELESPLTFGTGGDVEVLEAELDLEGTRVTFQTPRGTLAVRSALLGSYNLENLTAVVAAAEALELPRAAVREGIAGAGAVPGRLERVQAGQPFPIFVDYAHTPEALAAALTSVRSLTQGKLAVVFGCGGDRDRSKRPLMGRVVGELAELPIVTSDNPRDEDPMEIIAAVEEGLKASGNQSYRLLPDRRDAIRRALSVAGPGWVVVVAGKGAETGQTIAGRTLPFSDRDEIQRAVEEGHGVPNGR